MQHNFPVTSSTQTERFWERALVLVHDEHQARDWSQAHNLFESIRKGAAQMVHPSLSKLAAGVAPSPSPAASNLSGKTQTSSMQSPGALKRPSATPLASMAREPVQSLRPPPFGYSPTQALGRATGVARPVIQDKPGMALTPTNPSRAAQGY